MDSGLRQSMIMLAGCLCQEPERQPNGDAQAISRLRRGVASERPGHGLRQSGCVCIIMQWHSHRYLTQNSCCHRRWGPVHAKTRPAEVCTAYAETLG